MLPEMSEHVGEARPTTDKTVTEDGRKAREVSPGEGESKFRPSHIEINLFDS